MGLSNNKKRGRFLLLFGVCSILSIVYSIVSIVDYHIISFQEQQSSAVQQRHREQHYNSAKQNQTQIKQGVSLSRRKSDNDDLSWLNEIRPGNWLGSGAYSDTFEAIFDNAPAAVDNNKEYILKFTGDYKNEENYISFAAHAVDVVDRLTPYHSIPETLHFVASIPNPFQTGQYLLPNTTMAVKDSSGVQDLNFKRLRKSHNVSITVSERVTQTHKHYVNNKLKIPANKVRCFWRQFFDTLSHAHSKNIMMTDTKPWNVLLENGQMKFFDWNLAWIFESKQDRQKRLRELNVTRRQQPFHVCSEGDTKEKGDIEITCDSVHGFDVRKVGKRIGEFLDVDKKKRSKKHRKANTYLTREDRDLLKDMHQLMIQTGTVPTFQWFLKNHSYFTVENSDNCILLW